jgi:hypothetical protein
MGMIGKRQVPWTVAAALIVGLLVIDPPIVGYVVEGRYSLPFMLWCQYKILVVVVVPMTALIVAASAVLFGFIRKMRASLKESGHVVLIWSCKTNQIRSEHVHELVVPHLRDPGLRVPVDGVRLRHHGGAH